MTSYESYTEIEIIVLLKQGDIQAFDHLYQKYHRAIFFNALKLTKDQALAEDIVQDVFIKLWEKKFELDGHRSLPGWLFTVSYHIYITVTRNKLRALKYQQESMFINKEDERDQDVEEFQYTMLEKAVEQLSPQKRRVFELCKIQRKTYEEAAVELNISKHTVKEYLSEAVAFLRSYISQHPELKVILPAGICLNMLLSS